MIKGIFVVLGLLAGCAPTRGREYVVHVDPAFTPDEKIGIANAMDDWEQHARVRLDMQDGGCPGHQDGHICIAPSGLLLGDSGVVGLTNAANLYDGGMIRIEIAPFRVGIRTVVQFQSVVAHELGHAFGLPHLRYGTLMFAANSVGYVTVDDVYAFNDLRSY